MNLQEKIYRFFSGAFHGRRSSAPKSTEPTVRVTSIGKVSVDALEQFRRPEVQAVIKNIDKILEYLNKPYTPK